MTKAELIRTMGQVLVGVGTVVVGITTLVITYEAYQAAKVQGTDQKKQGGEG